MSKKSGLVVVLLAALVGIITYKLFPLFPRPPVGEQGTKQVLATAPSSAAESDFLTAQVRDLRREQGALRDQLLAISVDFAGARKKFDDDKQAIDTKIAGLNKLAAAPCDYEKKVAVAPPAKKPIAKKAVVASKPKPQRPPRSTHVDTRPPARPVPSQQIIVAAGPDARPVIPIQPSQPERIIPQLVDKIILRARVIETQEFKAKDGPPRPNAAMMVRFDNGVEVRGVTNANGVFEAEFPPGVRCLDVWFEESMWPYLYREVRIGSERIQRQAYDVGMRRVCRPENATFLEVKVGPFGMFPAAWPGPLPFRPLVARN